ncbi:MAG TPA: hypothetical protein VNW52_08050, partial [Burkholderiaceae bacterium]|nr:hypothetical protein [Burkholderiaceae bacterium]
NCQHCGQVNYDLAKRCVGCGAVMVAAEQKEQGGWQAGDDVTMRQDGSINFAAKATLASTSNTNQLDAEPAPISKPWTLRRIRKYLAWTVVAVSLLSVAVPLVRPMLNSNTTARQFFSQEIWLLLLAPMLFGAIAVYVKEGGGKPLRWRDYVIAPILPLSYLSGIPIAILPLLYLGGCTMIGGIIGGVGGVAVCIAGGFVVGFYVAVLAVIALPFAFVAAAVGGLIMGFFYRLISGRGFS